MTEEIVHTGFPRNQIVEFGGLPVVDALPSRESRDVREFAAEVLERQGAPVPDALPPDAGRDEARLRAALADPGSVAWWLPLISWAGDRFAYTGDHLRALARRVSGGEVAALVLGGTLAAGRPEDDADDPGDAVGPPAFTVPPPEEADEQDDDEVLAKAVEAMAGRAADFPNLRALFVGEIDDDQQCACSDVDAALLLDALPGLAELTMCAHIGLRFRAVEHTALRRLSLHGVLPPDDTARLAACRLPALEHLELWSIEDFSDAQDPGERAALDALFRGDTMPALRHLGLREFTFADDMVGQLAASALLPRLASLDLSRSAVTDRGGADAPRPRRLPRPHPPGPAPPLHDRRDGRARPAGVRRGGRRGRRAPRDAPPVTAVRP
ncbi:hypothetical protein [Actinomadura sediminis]|uniref:Leucine-rich repeat domain-containing protein n=1 Tax=Actinomadura sediminis TaxID=1038904 RepID=A0ABW3EZD2_9ACTN